jgi:CRISPR-associated endonuclease/helicase Cas3
MDKDYGGQEIIKLSAQARILWAKTPNKYSGAVEGVWLPLYIHSQDACEVAKLLWEFWVPPGTKRQVHGDPDFGRRLFLFFATLHDLGKATPIFQSKAEDLAYHVQQKLPMQYGFGKNMVQHSVAGHALLCSYLTSNGSDVDVAETYAVVIGGHHGKSPMVRELLNFSKHRFDEEMGFSHKNVPCEDWIKVQNEFIDYAIQLAELTESDLSFITQNALSISGQTILTGLVIMADWISSSFDLIDLLEFGEIDSAKRANEAWNSLQIPSYWHVPSSSMSAEQLFSARFELLSEATLRPVQSAAIREISNADHPGLVIIEAPMGEGKTEAALAVAEILAAKSGKGGVFMALPTQATSNGIFGRIKGWINRFPGNEKKSVFLAHGKAALNDEYTGIQVKRMNANEDEDNENAVANDWLQGRKKGILSDFVIGTVDHVLMGALQSKHLALRHLGLANKVVIIDECHAYDAYMVEYLYKVLRWLREYDVPVIVLSATLPSSTRKRLVDSYLGGEFEAVSETDRLDTQRDPEGLTDWKTTRAYPLITFTDSSAVRSVATDASGRDLHVEFQIVENDETLLALLDDLTSDGGCVGIIRNTVRSAQEIAEKLQDKYEYENVLLIHSAFISIDRIEIEKKIIDLLGPNKKRPERIFVVGTQVLEQSLDIDFDLLCSDLCPIDLLIQRIGREQRHHFNQRPPKLHMAKCLITGVEFEQGIPKFDMGADYIYGRYHLYTAMSLIMSNDWTMELPVDIPRFVQDAYAEDGVVVPEIWQEDYAKSQQEEDRKVRDKRSRAEDFQISVPGDSLVNWFGDGISVDRDIQAEATVRDTNDTLEVMVVQRYMDGTLHLLSWIEEYGGVEIPQNTEPENAVAKVIASCTLSLPVRMSREYNIDRTINELEKSGWIEAWQKSKWLEGALILVLDDKLSAVVGGFELVYDERTGLSVKELDDEKNRQKRI